MSAPVLPMLCQHNLKTGGVPKSGEAVCHMTSSVTAADVTQRQHPDALSSLAFWKSLSISQEWK